jgi:putative methyltransferase (TIGR04325 family)
LSFISAAIHNDAPQTGLRGLGQTLSVVERMSLKHFIPPAIIEMTRRALPSMPTFASYDDAAAQCGAGYGDDELVRAVVEKTRRYRDLLQANRTVISSLREASVATAIGLSAEAGRLNCIDFGGAAGAHFFLARSLFRQSLKLNWSVVETQAMASESAKLLTDGLRFFSDIGAAASSLRSAGESIDLVFTSCALPYVRDPLETLRELIGIGARRIFVTRNPLAEKNLERRVAIQSALLSSNGPGHLPAGFTDRTLKFPVTFQEKNVFEGLLSERYDIDLTFLEEKDAYYLNGAPVPMYGYLGRLKPYRGATN